MAPPSVRENRIEPLPPPTPDFQRLGALVSAEAEAAPRTPNNLPLELSSFVGRQEEVAEVERLLEGNRLLTLTGPGGCGKTRLALAAAGDAAGRFGDGVWLAELAPVADPVLVGRVVASALGIRGRPGRPMDDTLAEYIGIGRVLLVLDNCEHLVGACAGITESLLRSCPGLRVLATSREALGVVGEVARPVPPLALPDLRRLPDVGRVALYGAARLFVERASAISPTFALTERNAASVARVCYRLDGIPLAIELAAARTKVLTVEEISARLDDCFELLVAGGRTAMPRHKTLHATMDWSHDLLSGPERALPQALGLRRWFLAGCRGIRVRGGRPRAGRGAWAALAPGGQVVGDRPRGRRRGTLSPAGDRSAVRAGEASRVRGRGRGQAAARRVLPRVG